MMPEEIIAKGWVCGDCLSPVRIKGYTQKYFECTSCGLKGNVIREDGRRDNVSTLSRELP